jgi:beta-glucanase (GH16 family)
VLFRSTVGANSKLVFSSNFVGLKLDTRVWETCYPWMRGMGGCTNFGNSDETEWYLPSQARVSGGALHLVAQRVPTNGRNKAGAIKTYYCRSGMVTTFGSFQFQYGYVQIVARVPYATGLWPAIWLAAANERWPPEIDMLEHWDAKSQYSVYFHPTGGPRLNADSDTPNLSVGWHVFSLYWSKSSLIWYIDGRKLLSTNQHIPHQQMYIIANLADTKSPQRYGGCSGTLLVQSVKVWQP